MHQFQSTTAPTAHIARGLYVFRFNKKSTPIELLTYVLCIRALKQNMIQLDLVFPPPAISRGFPNQNQGPNNSLSIVTLNNSVIEISAGVSVTVLHNND